MFRSACVAVLVLVLALGAGAFSSAEAGDPVEECCEQCGLCSFPPGSEKGSGCAGPVPNKYSMTCYPGDCAQCAEGENLVTDEGVSLEHAMRDLGVAPSRRELKNALRGSRDRLLINSPRNMVLVLAPGCSNQDIVSSILFVEPQLIERLAALGIESYREFLSRQASAT